MEIKIKEAKKDEKIVIDCIRDNLKKIGYIAIEICDDLKNQEIIISFKLLKENDNIAKS